MATLVEKDALIERVTSVRALISLKTSYSGVPTDNQKRMTELRSFLYSSYPEDINFWAVADECKTIYEKYAAMPKFKGK